MRTSLVLSFLAGVPVVVSEHPGQTTSNQNKIPETGGSDGVTNKYILELESNAMVGSMAKQLAARPDKPVPYYQAFDCSDIFQGMAIETDTDNCDTLRALDGVVNVWSMKTIPMTPDINKSTIEPLTKFHNYSMHQWTGVDKLHAAGIRGKGVTVAIVDTGIDYTHKALGGCFGAGCKVAGGYDLVGPTWQAYDERQYPKKPDDNPMDYFGHGTHVAGIIAAENDWLVGVAPDAELLIYKVFADDPINTDEATLIQAFCDAYSAGADVISASIGRADGFDDDPWAVIASRIVDKGIVVTISAGNDGYTGPFYSSSGSDGHGVLSVAAVNVSGNPNISITDPSAAPIVAYFNSWGPTNEMLIKPDIGAPGFDVISTVLDQGFAEMSGTSMAAPYIAGVAALYIGQHGGRDIYGPGFAEMLRRRIISSGKSVAWSASSVLLNQTAPPWQVGTGMVDAQKVVQYGTQLNFEPFALLDTQHFQPNWTAVIQNTANETVTYTFELEPQPGVDIYDANYGVADIFELVPKHIVPGVHLPDSVEIKPKMSKAVEFSFELPKGVDRDFLPLYSGKISINGSNGERLSIPYGGAAYDTELAFATMFTAEPYLEQHNSAWAWSFNVNKDPTDFAQLTATLAYPCFDLRWDIYDSYYREDLWEYPPKVGENGYIGAATSMRDAEMYFFYDASSMNKNDTVAFPMTRITRGYNSFWWFGKLANGTQIAPGNYTMRFAALRPFGDPKFSTHWDLMGGSWDLPLIEVLPYNATNATSFNIRRQ